jgi:hypothetical protein
MFGITIQQKIRPGKSIYKFLYLKSFLPVYRYTHGSPLGSVHENTFVQGEDSMHNKKISSSDWLRWSKNVQKVSIIWRRMRKKTRKEA